MFTQTESLTEKNPRCKMLRGITYRPGVINYIKNVYNLHISRED
jgi:hypothetical protein